jgi:hypothetical protein
MESWEAASISRITARISSSASPPVRSGDDGKLGGGFDFPHYRAHQLLGVAPGQVRRLHPGAVQGGGRGGARGLETGDGVRQVVAVHGLLTGLEARFRLAEPLAGQQMGVGRTRLVQQIHGRAFQLRDPRKLPLHPVVQQLHASDQVQSRSARLAQRFLLQHRRSPLDVLLHGRVLGRRVEVYAQAAQAPQPVLDLQQKLFHRRQTVRLVRELERPVCRGQRPLGIARTPGLRLRQCVAGFPQVLGVVKLGVGLFRPHHGSPGIAQLPVQLLRRHLGRCLRGALGTHVVHLLGHGRRIAAAVDQQHRKENDYQ